MRPMRTAAIAVGLVAGCAAATWADGVQELQPRNADSDRMPLYTVVPDYPKVARRDRIEGEVQVCFEVNREGRPRRIGVRKSSHRIFEKPSIRAVRASIYAPLSDDEELPIIKHCRTFRFTLEPVVRETES